MPLSDTSPEIEAIQSRILDAMTGEQRIVRALELCHLIREVAKAGLRHRHPDWSEQRVSSEFLLSLFGPGAATAETMSNSNEAFRRIADLLKEIDIPHMLVGSFACACYGWIRSAMDVDLVILCSSEQIPPLVRRLRTMNYYADETSALQSLQKKSAFQVFDMQTEWKIDLIALKPTLFGQGAFRRRQAFEFQGLELFVTSPEDLVVGQLEWAKTGGSFVQIRDAATLLKKRWSSLDHSYLKKWLDELGLAEQWRTALQEADIQPI